MRIFSVFFVLLLLGSAGAYEDIPESYSFPDVSPYVRGLGGEHQFYDDTASAFSRQNVATSLSFSKAQYHIRVGEKLSLHVVTEPFDADISSLDWRLIDGDANNDLIGTGRHAVLRGLSEGAVTVHVELGRLFAETVVIVDKCSPDEISIAVPSVTLSAGESISLALRVSPADAVLDEISWSIIDGAEHAMLEARGNAALLGALSSGKVRIGANSSGLHTEIELMILAGDAPAKTDGILNSLPKLMQNTGVGLLALSWTGYSVQNHRRKHKNRSLS